MGNSHQKKISETTKLAITFESNYRSYNGTEPILANISIDSEELVHAYGL